MNKLAKLLIRERKRKGESLQEAADGIGISKTHLWEIEKGRTTNPTYKVLIGIMKHYNVTANELLKI